MPCYSVCADLPTLSLFPGRLDASDDSEDLDLPVPLAASLYRDILHGPATDTRCRQYAFMLLQRAARAGPTLYRCRGGFIVMMSGSQLSRGFSWLCAKVLNYLLPSFSTVRTSTGSVRTKT